MDISPKISLFYLPALLNKARALKTLGQHEEVRKIGSFVDTMEPFNLAQSLELAFIFASLLQNKEAIRVYRRNIKECSNDWKSRYGLGIMLLRLGNFQEGFQEYEYRLKMDLAPLPTPYWKGEKIEGKTLLVRSEQGLGDTIQFLRYVPLLSQYKCKVILQLPFALKGLFDHLEFPLIYEGSLSPKHDIQVNLMSLPWVFKTTLSTIPSPTSFQTRLHPIQNRIGIVWKGNPAHPQDSLRSIPLETFFLPIPGVQYISLQKELTPEETIFLDARAVQRPQLNSWSETLELLATCKQVICVDTSIAHLAASMGIDTFVLIPYAPDWRWMMKQADSPWYPSMKLFRQSKINSWQEPLEEIKNILS